MRTEAFKMKLRPGCEAEYERRHQAIWPELKDLLHQNGISDYHIFLDSATLTLFAVQKVAGEGGSQDLGSDPVVRRWWNVMADLMEVNPDNSPVSVPLSEVFSME